ncbi:MAG: hypothetical protein QNJ71_10735 [Acidimicrobiia bacterium]|nr:hypothetical protein [Acidimicrobiia bacterium]
MSEPGDHPTLREALVEAYPHYVASVLAQRGIDVDELTADAIVEGTGVLDGLLTTFERTPMVDQRSSPLELFREALRPVDRALELRGIDTPSGQGSGVPAWDRHQLSPGSSQVLGSVAHEAHLRWAVTKATAIAPLVNRPAVFLVSMGGDEEVVSALESAGFRPVSTIEDASLALIDDGVDGAGGLVRSALARNLTTVVYGEAIDDLRQLGLLALGVDRVVSRDDLVEQPSEVLPSLA